MYFLALGCLLLVLKLAELGPVAELSWWWVLAPFALAALWWNWADASGYTKRKATEEVERRREERRARTKESLEGQRRGRR